MNLNRSLGLPAIAQDLVSQRTLVVRTPKATYGFRYSGLLHWEATDSKLILQFAHACVTVHGKDLLKLYVHKLPDDRLAELVEPQRTDQFRQGKEGSAGIERIQVQIEKE